MRTKGGKRGGEQTLLLTKKEAARGSDKGGRLGEGVQHF